MRNPSALIESTAKSAQQTAQKTAQTASQNPEALLQRVRNMDQGTLIAGGVLFAEAIGFFTVGEMIGRMKIVGYRGEVHHEH